MKKLAVTIALGASLISSAAIAGEQRPTYIAFKAPAAASATTASVSPAAPVVRKRNEAFGTLPIYVPIIGAIAVIGLVVAVSSGSNGSPG